MVEIFLVCQRFGAQNLPLTTLGDDFERAAANLAIGCEPLAGQACINGHSKILAAERALNIREFFHAENLNPCLQSAILLTDLFPVCH
jgi:hypothetical protein